MNVLFNGNILASATMPSSPDYFPEQYPALAVEARKLYLVNRKIVAGTGVDFYSRQQHADFQIFQIGGLAHHVFARQHVSALLEHLHDRLRGRIAEYVQAVPEIAVWIIFFHPRPPLLDR